MRHQRIGQKVPPHRLGRRAILLEGMNDFDGLDGTLERRSMTQSNVQVHYCFLRTHLFDGLSVITARPNECLFLLSESCSELMHAIAEVADLYHTISSSSRPSRAS